MEAFKDWATVSRNCGVEAGDEFVIREFGCRLIQAAGVLLKLPQKPICIAKCLWHRVLRVHSLSSISLLQMCCACLSIACKAEEFVRRLRDIILTVHHVFLLFRLSDEHLSDAHRDGGLPSMDYYGNHGYLWKTGVLDHEAKLLSALGFSTFLELPHTFLLLFIEHMKTRVISKIKSQNQPSQNQIRSEQEKWHQILQSSWNSANDALHTPLCTIVSPETIAVGCIGRVCRELGYFLPNSIQYHQPERNSIQDGAEKDKHQDTDDITTERLGWWSVFGARYQDLQVVDQILDLLYSMTENEERALPKRAEDIPLDEFSKLVLTRAEQWLLIEKDKTSNA